MWSYCYSFQISIISLILSSKLQTYLQLPIWHLTKISHSNYLQTNFWFPTHSPNSPIPKVFLSQQWQLHLFVVQVRKLWSHPWLLFLSLCPIFSQLANSASCTWEGLQCNKLMPPPLLPPRSEPPPLLSRVYFQCPVNRFPCFWLALFCIFAAQ